MTISTRSIALFLICFGVASVGQARTPVSKAEAVIAASKRATGGAAWDSPQGCTETGTHADGAVTYLTRFSLRGYGMRTDSDRGGNNRSVGFDGKVRWQAAGTGNLDIRSDPASLQEGIVTDYLSINGFFFPDRFPASFKYLRVAREAGRKFDVIEITPEGGRALEVWFDGRTHLIQRVVDSHGTPAVRVEANDYRRANGLTVAYKLDIFGPDGTVADRGAVTSFRCGPVESAIFAPPLVP